MAPRIVALVLAARACWPAAARARADKAGGSSTPVVLRLADSNNSDQPDTGALEYFAAQVAKRSGGTLRIRITYLAAGSATPHVEERTIAAVRAGRFDLGWIGARAWDEVGVKSFRALQAPFLITSKRLLDRVVTSPLAGEMLDSLETQNVVGVALVPDYLRHPVGMGRPLVSPADFVGARVRIQPSRVSAAVMKALGAIPVTISNAQIGYAIDQKRVDGQEVAMLSNPGGSVLAGNVVLFAKAMTLFANHDSYGRLGRRTAARAPGRRRRDRAPRRRAQSHRRADRAALLLRQAPDSARHSCRARDRSRGRRSRSTACSRPTPRRNGSSGRSKPGSARRPPIRRCPIPAGCRTDNAPRNPPAVGARHRCSTARTAGCSRATMRIGSGARSSTPATPIP